MIGSQSSRLPLWLANAAPRTFESGVDERSLFTHSRTHTGGQWTGQYQLIDAEAFTQVEQSTGRLAYVHSASKIYIPGSAADGQEQFPTFPAVEVTLRERLAEGRTLETTPATERRNLEGLQTEHHETLVSSERESLPEDLDPASNAGGVDAETDSDLRAVKTSVPIDMGHRG